MSAPCLLSGEISANRNPTIFLGKSGNMCYTLAESSPAVDRRRTRRNECCGKSPQTLPAQPEVESRKFSGAVPDRVLLRFEFGPAFEGSQLLAGCSVVEAKFGLFEKEGKVGFRNAVVSTERALGLVPEVLNSVDVIVAIENLGV